ncbi:histidine--tRNA ligase [Candidatus Omnitrophota bacterium]
MKIIATRGTKDSLPSEVQAWQLIEEKARTLFKIFGYNEIRTPIFEQQALFERSLGRSTDIVQKQLISLQSAGKDVKEEKKLALRPEGTAPIVRAYIEHNIDKKEKYVKYGYVGPMFRGERPQKGRLRQFHHIGVEVIGSNNSYVDVEVIALAYNLLMSFGINGFQIKINNLGCAKDKLKLSTILKKLLKVRKDELCELCKDRFERNVFRILDCKNKDCIAIVKELKIEEQHICDDCSNYFRSVLDGLRQLSIPFEVSPLLVRGLDYYTRTVFEITHDALGSQDALGAGGRYDNLVKELGGPEKPAVGFALGLERILLVLGDQQDAEAYLDVYVVTLGEEAFKKGFSLLQVLRSNGIASDLDYENASLKKQMSRASKAKAPFVILLGEDEVKKDVCTLKDMASGAQEEVSAQEIIKRIQEKL